MPDGARGVTVTIAGPVKVVWTNEDGSEDREVSDEETLRAFDGRTYLDDDADAPVPLELGVYLQDGPDTRPLWDLGVRGGTLRYEYRGAEHELWIVSEFRSPRALADAELRALRDFVQGQWYDGAGPSFAGELADENGGVGPLGHPTSVHVWQTPA